MITGKILKQSLDKDGYVVYKLPNREGKIKTYKAHRLVARHFLIHQPVKKKNKVNHKDGNTQNNFYKNLEYCTTAYNNKHARDNGLHNVNGEKNGNSIYSSELIHEICKLMCQGKSNYEIKHTLDIPSKGKSRTSKDALLSAIR